MNLKTFAIAAAACCSLSAAAQTTPIANYTEPFDNTVTGTADWQKLGDEPQISWASRDVHYAQRQVPAIRMRSDTAVWAWRGERVGMQAVIFCKNAVPSMRLAVAGNDGLDVKAQFVNYVISDGFRGCRSNPMTSPLEYVPDIIGAQQTKDLRAMSVTPVWVTIEVPRDVEAGDRQLTVNVVDNASGKTIGTLDLNVHIVDRQLPEPKDYVFNTNFWQQPYAIARYHNVPRWSQAHFDAMKPYLRLLARCGQKSVTAFIVYQPWGDQNVVDVYDEMIKPTKKNDGTWTYDYSVFDHYVQLCDSCGINGQINCFTMVTWGTGSGVNGYKMNFRYYDEAGNVQNTGNVTINSDAYRDYWTNFLKAFAAHLKEKGWFNKTFIAMDERGLDVMQAAYDLVKQTVPDMRMSLAGDYHSQLADKLYDYCVAYGQKFTEAELKQRKDSGWITTTYTSCTNIVPNMQAYNDPADVTYLPLYAMANKFDGYLHWAIFHWPENPLTDTRFKNFSPGDTYDMYPGPLSSVRYERYIEGVEQAEKIRLLREAWSGDTERLDSLEAQLQKFSTGELNYISTSSRLVNVLEAILNGSPKPGIEPSAEYCSTSLQSKDRATAIAQRWLTEATVTGDAVSKPVQMSWSKASDAGYVMANDTVTLQAGKSVTFNLKASQQGDGLQWCRVGFFADWDNDRNFGSRDDELVNMTGSPRKENADVRDYNVTFTVPVDAVPGATRLRVTYNDAWGDVPVPCGELRKGFCIDFPVIIKGQATAISAVSKTVGVEWTAGGLKADGKVNVAVYNLQGMLLDLAKGVKDYSFAALTPGTYIIRAVDARGNATQKTILK